MPHPFKKILRNFRDYGFFVTLHKVMGRFLTPIVCFRIYILYKADLTESEIPKDNDTSIVIRTIDPTEKDLITQIFTMEEWLEGYLEEILHEGGLCFVALDGNIVTGFNLVSYQRINLPPVRFTQKLDSHQAYSEQISISRSYRKKGLASRLRYEVYRTLLTQGIQQIYGGTDISNLANLALSQKVGLISVATIHYRKLLWTHKTTIEKLDK